MENKLIVVKILTKTMNETILRKFVESEGLKILNEWVCLYTKDKGDEETKDDFMTL